jgi:DNA-binding NarL/FixJ family response regulator
MASRLHAVSGRLNNEVSIIFPSATQDPLYVKAAMNLGGNGYVFKSSLASI